MSQPWPVQFESASESDQTSLSPRTALLSPTPFSDIDEPRRIPRGPGLRFRRERERVHSTASPRDLMHMLVNEEYESKQTRKILYTAFDRLEHESKRGDAAEGRIEEMLQRVRSINDARLAAQQQAARAQEELKLYKLQLDNAQKEILRAQDVLKAIETQRDQAEAAAVSARSKARRLNEERLIELAREEGRRLGFEEGVRRGRRIGYREVYESEIEDGREGMRDLATVVVDRLLEAPDEPEHIEVQEEPTPIPPPPSISRTPPEVHRVPTPVNSSLENQHRGRRDSDASRSTLKRPPDPVIPPPPVVEQVITPGIPSIPTITSQTSRSQSGSQPWAGSPTDPRFSRPISIQNSPPSVRRSEIHVPPDGFIPAADSGHHIPLPPPHELHRNIPSPTPPQRASGRGFERGRSRDYMYESFAPPRRGSPDDSLASGKQSASSTLSQLDIVGLPSSARHRDRSHGLSVIHEDASMRSERMTDYSQTVTSTPYGGQSAFPDMRSSETLRQDRKAKQRPADELGYPDPSAAEQWRHQSNSSRSRQPHDVPPRPMPSQMTVSIPLSPPRVLQQPDLRYRRTASERQGRSETRSEHRDQHRLSSDSSVPEINVEPPSGPPSDAPSRGHGNASGLLSPDHANLPLPIPAPPGTNGRNSPVIPNVPNYSQTSSTGQIYAAAPDRQIPLGFLPSPTAGNGSSQAPVIPRNTGQQHAPLSRAPSERETGRSRSPISFYAAAPVPSGVTYPAPPISRSATYKGNGNFYAGSNPSLTSEGGRRRRDSTSATAVNGVPFTQSTSSNPSLTSEGRRRRDSVSATSVNGMPFSQGISGNPSDSHRRRDSLSASAGMTPAPRAKPIPTTGGRDSRVSRRQSTASLASQRSRPYSRYDPSVYNEPAYLASSDSLVDSVTGANTAANGGGGPVRPVRMQGSPAYMYTTLQTNE